MMKRINVLLLILFAGGMFAQATQSGSHSPGPSEIVPAHNAVTGPELAVKGGYASRPAEYTVTNVTAINTDKPEFSPFALENKLLFIAARSSFDFSDYSIGKKTDSRLLNLYVSDIEGTKAWSTRLFSKRLSAEYQNGPACLSGDGQTFYFTRISNSPDGERVNQARIFVAQYSGGKLKKIRPLEINSREYSVAHPCISPDGNTLYFTSNMPGGFGGKDIWKCESDSGVWGRPANLGPDINTSGDEMFPSMRKDGTLFFSSNGLPGFGGHDIYSAKIVEGKWLLLRNEGLHLNSSANDFGVFFVDDSTGYFSSSREGGMGEEDIFQFIYRNRSIGISATVLLTENLMDYAKNKRVLLLDENGNVIDSVYTDAKGRFRFNFLDAEKKYMASIEETDPVLAGKARFYLMHNDSTISRVSTRVLGKRFVFKNLPVVADGLPELYADDDLVFAGTLKYGEASVPFSNVRIRIVNEFGDVVKETYTNKYGSFAFRNIPADQNYLVSIEESELKLPEGTKIVLLNKSGKEVRSYLATRDKFVFKVIQSDKELLSEMNVEEASLVMGIYGILYDQDKKPIPNARVKVRDERGADEREWITGENGKFNFKNLPADRNYIFEADESDPAFSNVRKIYIGDNNGRIYKSIDRLGGKFTFRMVEADKFLLGEFVADDPWLKVADLVKSTGPETKNRKSNSGDSANVASITIVENIYYAFGDYQLNPSACSILDKAADALKSNPGLFMEISAHTDSKASDEFNMELSKKRARTAVSYLVKKGVSPARLKATGYGESKLLNECANGVDCSEEQHKKNRRTEFKFSRP